MPRFLREMEPAWVFQDGMVRPTAATRFNRGQIDRYYDKIFKELYFYHTGECLPANLCNYVDLHGSEIPNQKFTKAVGSSINMGNGVFRYACWIVDDPPSEIWWFTTFYNGFHVSVFTKQERRIGDLLKLKGRISKLRRGECFRLEAIDHESSMATLKNALTNSVVRIRKGFLYKFEISLERQPATR